MNTKDLHQKADDIIDKTEDMLDQAKENVEDMVTEGQKDINRKGGEVKGRAEQWQTDRSPEVNDMADSINNNQDRYADPADLDKNPLDSDTA
jgi:hypothetical protein